MKITVSDTIMSSSMGEGWQHDAATGYAEYAAEKLAEVVREKYPDAEVKTEFRTGCGPALSVDVETDDLDQKFEIENDLTDYLLNYYDRVWSAWCGGDGSDYFEES